MRKFIYLCSHLCVQVPLLPIAVLTVIPLAVCPSWRPWGAADIPVLGNPGVGQWIVIIVVAYTIIDTVRGMICGMAGSVWICWLSWRSPPRSPCRNTGRAGPWC